MKNFHDFHLPEGLNYSLEQMGFETPTPIQAQAIPHALQGRDILGSAQTGTGKTGAFLIPLMNHLITNPESCGLVIAPTRELAQQVMQMAIKLRSRDDSLRIALLIGGEPMPKQFEQLRGNPRLIIGTPGRIDDHCRRRNSLLQDVDMLVLDEADRMLDMGFSVQIDSILAYMPKQRQTLMFSATFEKSIVKFANQYLNNPVRVEIEAEKITAENIHHDVKHVPAKEKHQTLTTELRERDGSIIIFVKTKMGADRMAQTLSKEGFQAEPIHGDLRQRQRDRTIRDFRNQRFRILVATDVAARGLDIPHIEHVINFDLPQNPEDYVHRIGRTARAGATGHALCFVTPSESGKWRAIQRLVFPDQVANDDDDRGRGRGRGRGKGRPSVRGGERSGRGGFGRDNNKGGFRSRDKNKSGGNKRRNFKSYDNNDSWGNEGGEKRPSRNKGDFKPAAFRDKKDDRGFEKRRERNDGERSFEKKSNRRDDSRDNRGDRFEGRSEKRFDGNKGEKRNFGNRNENSRRDDRNEGRSEKRFDGNKSEKRFDNKGEKRFGKRSESNSENRPTRKSFSDKPRSDKPRSDKPRSEKSGSDRFKSDRPKMDKRFADPNFSPRKKRAQKAGRA